MSDVTVIEIGQGTVEVIEVASVVNVGNVGKAKVSSDDTTLGFLQAKLVAGSNVTLTVNNDGANETITIAASSGGVTDHGALTGLGDDDHTIYALADGTRWTTTQTASRAIVSDASGYLVVSAVTATELGYLSGVTSGIQGQINGKAATSHSHAASDITSGTLDNARVNWASPSAIGSGTAAAITGTLVIATDQLEVGNVAVRLTTLGLTRIGSSSNQYFKSQSSRMTIGANSAGIQFDISSGQQALLTATGLAVGSSTPSARLHVTETSAVTNAVIEVERVQAASTGTPSAGFGGRQLFALQNAIGTVRNAGAIDVVWTNAASGTEYASLHLKAGTANTLNTILRLGYDSANADFVELPGTTPFYMGDLGTDGTWRLMRSGNDLLIQRRESGTYVTKSTITA